MNIESEQYTKIPPSSVAVPDVDVEFAALADHEQIGSGGRATVVKAVEPRSETAVALKQPVFDETLHTDCAESFLSEAETWAQIDSHEGIVTVLDWDSQPVPWIALEYMDGGSLADRPDVGRREAVWIGAKVADAVWQAHQCGVAHLDLTPANVLFRSTASRYWDIPKVGDWGLARSLLDGSGDIEGVSPHYAAPEQLDPDTFGSPNQLTDIYQLGALLYELLTGRRLFVGEPSTIVIGQLSELPTPPTTVDPTLPTAVDDILGTALQKEHHDRYESMLDFRRDLIALFRQLAFDEEVSLVCHRQTESARRAWSETNTGSDHEPTDRTTVSAGSTLSTSTDEAGVVDNIRGQAASNTPTEFPWQHRDQPPGLASETSDRGQQTPENNKQKTKTKNVRDTSRASSSSPREPDLFELLKQVLERFP